MDLFSLKKHEKEILMYVKSKNSTQLAFKINPFR